ncbi:MAG: TonB-dependent receptor [Alphaproteobacteria bacterium]|nr:TonB-dependent receptor [Alphaproteobacteria bacterium]
MITRIRVVVGVRTTRVRTTATGALRISATTSASSFRPIKASPSAPRWLAGARLGHQHAFAGRFELEWVHVGGYWLDAGNSERYGGHDLWHLRWQRALSPSWHGALRLMNLANRRYAERADLAFGTFRYFPGAGRSLFVELAWRHD